jgi:hypothetical protein
MNNIQVKNRRLVRDWVPRQPSRPSEEVHFMPLERRKWTEQRKCWLEENYPNCENDQLALAIGCDTGDVSIVAKRMDLQKSHEFLLYKKLSSLPSDSSCPIGYHWETQEEQAYRLELQRRQDLNFAMRSAMQFDFCTNEEQEHLAAAIYNAVLWGRATEEQ